MTAGCRTPGTRRRGRCSRGPPKRPKLMDVSDDSHISGEAPRAILTTGTLALRRHGVRRASDR